MPNATLDQLTPRGAVQGNDLLPILPSGGAELESTTAKDIQNFVLTSVKLFGAKGDGITDDTAALQAAINSQFPVYMPPGVYLISSTLNLTTVACHGQIIRGAGTTSLGGIGVNDTVIRPTSAVSCAFRIDGSAFGGYVEGFRFEDFSIDMGNMPDASTSSAINQIQAFSGNYSHIVIFNDGSYKRGWLFNAGAYTTVLSNCRANFVEATGQSTSNGVTTLDFQSFDGNQMQLTYAVNIRVYGGAFQGANSTKFRIRYAAAIQLDTDVEGSGIFLDVDSSVNALWSRCELQGFSGTYMAGTPGPSCILFDQQVNYNTYPFSLTVGTFRFNNQGAPGASSILSGGPSANCYLGIGRSGIDQFLGVAASANDWVSGTSAGDAVVASWGSASTLWLAGAQIPNANVTQTGFNTFGSGTLRQGEILVQPATNGDVFTIRNSAGAVIFDVNTSQPSSSSLIEAVNGTTILGYTDGFATQAFKLNGVTGVIQAGAQLYPGNGTGSNPILNSAAGILGGNGNPANSIGNNGDFYLRGDGTHGASNLLWHKEGGSWINVL